MNLQNTFLFFLNMSITASYVILAVILLRLFLKKAPKWISCALWSLVGLRLVFPFSIESVLSLIPSTKTVTADALYSAVPATGGSVPAVDSAGSAPLPDSLAPGVDAGVNPIQTLLTVAALIWIVGFVAMTLYSAVTYSKLRKKVSFSVPVQGNIYLCDGIASPFVLGLINPRIYLPFTINQRTVTNVVAHERAHIRRKDNWIKPLGFLLLTIYWFNPLVWVAYLLLCRDIELACDEAVISEIGVSRKKDYANAMLECSVNHRGISMCPVAFGEIGVKQRVKNILRFRKTAFWIIAAALLVCAVAAVCLLTNPVAPGIHDGTTSENVSSAAPAVSSSGVSSIASSAVSSAVSSTQASSARSSKPASSAAAVQQVKLDEKGIRTLADQSIYCMQHVIGLSALPTQGVPIRDNIYQVDESKFKDYAAFEKYIRSIYCKTEADRLLYNTPYEGQPEYLNIDGKLCVNMDRVGAKGYYVDWSKYEIKITNSSAAACEFTLTAAVEWPAENPKKESYPVKASAVYENGKWVLQKMFS